MALKDVQLAAGAVFGAKSSTKPGARPIKTDEKQSAPTDVPIAPQPITPPIECLLSFGNDAIAIAAATQDPNGIALYDATAGGRLRLTGDDRARFIHSRTTQNIQALKPGQYADATFVTSTARTIDLATLWVNAGEIIVCVAPERRQILLEMLDRYIFPMDAVELSDISAETACLTVIGAGYEALLDRLNIPKPPTGESIEMQIGGMPARLIPSSGLSQPGFTLLADRCHGAGLWQSLRNAGAVPMGEQAWEQVRILDGRPAPDRELTEDYNPLEAGLWHTVSFDKGCYIGQETIARLNTYQGVKQQLWGLRAAAPIEPGTPLMQAETKVGIVTSALTTATEAIGENEAIETTEVIGLGYVKTKVGGAGLTLTAAGVSVEVVDIPYASRGYLEVSKEDSR